MNLKKLKQAEADFLFRYPGGFNHPDMIEVGKRHRMDKMISLTREAFSKGNFERRDLVVENMGTIINRSSMISMFEKPRFRSFAKLLSPVEKELLVDGIEQRIYGNQQNGFETILDILKTGKLAKWSLISICPAYFDPNFEVYVKPTTVKKIINVLELNQLHYRPMPDWEFYRIFRDEINTMKIKVDPALSPSNAAFTGFLMMSL
jgi:hypothetical protein